MKGFLLELAAREIEWERIFECSTQFEEIKELCK